MIGMSKRQKTKQKSNVAINKWRSWMFLFLWSKNSIKNRYKYNNKSV